MGFSDIGCYGSEIVTPNLDKLAANGLRFTQFYNTARCCPTRAALMTGLYPHQAGVGHMMDDHRKPGYRGNLNRQCATIAEVLRTAGYQTMMTGKWHVTRHTDPEGPKFNWPTNRGFDSFYGTIHGAGSYYLPVALCRNDRMVREGGGDYYYTNAISDQAGKFIDEAARSPRPFFLYVAYTAPHWPLHAPDEVVRSYRGKYAAGWDELRERRHKRMIEMGLVDRQWPLAPRDARVRAWELAPHRDWHQRRMEVYAAQIDLMDQGIGRILEKLRLLGLEQNTLVMFMADNGGCAEEIGAEWKGPHIAAKTAEGRAVALGNNPNIDPGPADTYQSYGIAWANASNTPFRLYKHWVHEGGIASPLIVRWPGVINKAALVRDVGHVVDIMPTCLAAAKASYPKNLGGYTLTPLAGESLMPVFEGKSLPSRSVFWEHEGNRAVRDGKWKLVARHGAAWELYDMEADRTETNDLAQQFPVIVKDLGQQYEQWAARSNVEPWPLAK
jgi:arylsulfatase